MPNVVLGDLRAQVSSVLQGRARLQVLLERYGQAQITDAMMS